MYKTLKYALKVTLPVFFGYLVLGSAFGLLLHQAGYNFLWALFISIIVYAGSMQFVLVSFLISGLDLLSVALMTLSINSRHMFYGLSFIEKFKSFGILKYYMIYTMTDETYSLLTSVKTPDNMEEKKLFPLISALNHSYWILGSVIGAIAGAFIPFSIQGVEFSMTALFVVIFIEQWSDSKTHMPVYIGFACSVLCLIFFGPDKFILPSLAFTVLVLLITRKQIEPNVITKELQNSCR